MKFDLRRNGNQIIKRAEYYELDVMGIGNIGNGSGTDLCRSLVGFDQVFVVKLSPGEYVTPVAQIVRTIGQTIPENYNIQSAQLRSQDCLHLSSPRTKHFATALPA